MTTTDVPASAGGISDAAVRAVTGRGWAEWFAALDAFDVRANGHAAAARHLAVEHGCPDWWCQMVTVGYEQERGLRRKRQAGDGTYQASGSKTLAVPIERLYAAWADEEVRARWLAEPIAVRKATPNKSMRITWPDGTSVAVYFWVKGAAKSQVQISHEKLPDEAAAAAMKAYWAEALERLRGAVGS
jgi:hypothetical protein